MSVNLMLGDLKKNNESVYDFLLKLPESGREKALQNLERFSNSSEEIFWLWARSSVAFFDDMHQETKRDNLLKEGGLNALVVAAGYEHKTIESFLSMTVDQDRLLETINIYRHNQMV